MRTQRSRTLAIASACAVFLVVPSLPAGAGEHLDPPTVSFSADEVRVDGPSQTLDVSGHVRVDEPPFRLTSEGLKLRRLSIGARLEGEGRLAFCACLGTPLAVRFSAATVAPPHDLILQNPVLELFGVPLAWLPAVWLRSSGRVGFLPPDLAWRGEDGFFAGVGAHVPWRDGDIERGVSVRAGAYVDGGAAIETVVVTPATSTRVRWDRFRRDDGVSVDARGAVSEGVGPSPDSVAWRLSALREPRAVRAATDVRVAAQPFDRGSAEAAWRSGGWTLASAVRTEMLRGGRVASLGAGGPVLTARRSEGLGDSGAYEATLEGGQVAGAGLGAVSFARCETGLVTATRAGPLGASLALRGTGGVASDTVRQSASGAAQARAEMALPMARTYTSDEALDPWVHTTAPRLEGAAIATHLSGALVPVGRETLLADGAAWVVTAGWDNTVERYTSRTAAEIQAAFGAAGDSQGMTPLLRARARIEGPAAALVADAARVLRPSGAGGALVASARIGSTSGLHLGVHVAERDGVDPSVARALVDPAYEPASGFLAFSGWTGGARAGLPLGSRVSVRGGTEVDLDARALVAAVAALEVHDPCNCLVVRLSVAHRIGRGGADVWLSVDLPMASP